MKYFELVKFYQQVEKTRSRKEILNILADLFKKTPKEEIDKVVNLSIGKIAPEYKGLEYNFSSKSIQKVVSELFNISEKEIKELLYKFGDLGDAIKEIFNRYSKNKEPILLVSDVFNSLYNLASQSGYGALKKKSEIFKDLISKATPDEAKYIVRTILENLRLGIGDNTILDGLAIAFTGDVKNREIIENAYNIRPDLGYIASLLASYGLEKLKNLKIEVGIPIRPMLAERMAIPSFILKKLGGKAGVEYKYDGERIQVHRDGDKFILYSRRLENITEQFPDLIEFLKESIPKKCIVELEAVVIDVNSGQLRPFQDLMNRKVKYVSRFHILMYQIAGFIFDILYLNGDELINKPYPDRRKILEDNLKITDRIKLAERVIVDNVEDLEKFFLQAIEDGCEGVMCKSLDKNSVYKAGKRGYLWIKYKRDYKSKLADTLDLVVVGSFKGKGQRTEYFGSLLMACYDRETDTFKTICKVGSGFTEDDLKKITEILKNHRLEHRHPRVNSILSADEWYEPYLVLEITGAELTLSPVHTCCWDKIKLNRGLGLRFPRFTGRYRLDKKPEDATTEEEILEMYKNQLKIKL